MARFTHRLVILLTFFAVIGFTRDTQFPDDVTVEKDMVVKGSLRVNGGISAGNTEEGPISTTELTLSGETIINWSDLDSWFVDTLTQNPGTVASPYGVIAYKSGGTIYHRPVKGTGGITVTNDSSGILWIEGDVTNSVEALFPLPTTANYGAVYYRKGGGDPNDMVKLELDNTTENYFYWNGTNLEIRAGTSGVATDTALFDGNEPGHYRNMVNITNQTILDDTVEAVGSGVAFDFANNLSVSTYLWTNSSGDEITVVKIDAPPTAGGGNLASSNLWSEWNGFEDKVYLFSGAVRSGQGTTMGGTHSSVGIGGTNLTASGQSSTVGGGQNNTASSSGSTIAGGRNNEASGVDSTVSGGNNNRARAQGSAVFGGQYVDVAPTVANYSQFGGKNVDITNKYNFGYAVGSHSTNPVNSSLDYAIWFVNEDGTTNLFRVGVNTATPRGVADFVDGPIYVEEIIFPGGGSITSPSEGSEIDPVFTNWLNGVEVLSNVVYNTSNYWDASTGTLTLNTSEVVAGVAELVVSNVVTSTSNHWDVSTGVITINTSETTNADGVIVSATPSNYTALTDDAESHLAGLDDAVAPASTTDGGVIEIATQAEVDAGTNTTHAVTPDTLANYPGVAASVTNAVDSIDDGTTTASGISHITFEGATVTDEGGGTGKVTIAAGGGGVATVFRRFPVASMDWSLANSPNEVSSVTNAVGVVHSVRHFDQVTFEEGGIPFTLESGMSTNINLVIEGYDRSGETGAVQFVATQRGYSAQTNFIFDLGGTNIDTATSMVLSNFQVSAITYDTVYIDVGPHPTNSLSNGRSGDFSILSVSYEAGAE